MDSSRLNEEQLKEIYNWVDEIPLTRPKRNISRDFADGVLAAEIINYFFPNLVELHNYSSVNSVTQKSYNWKTLNTKVLGRLGIRLRPDQLTDIVQSQNEAIEEFLLNLKGA